MIPVCYCGNKKIFHGLLMSVLSLAKYSSDSIRLIVLSMDIPEQNPNFISFSRNQMEILNRVLKGYHPDSYAEMIDVTELYRTHMMHGKNSKNGYTPYAMIRLFLDVLPDIPDKLVYLDIDTMCTDDIKLLYDIDMEKYEFAAARDYMGSFWIHPDYCNSGVMLLNMAYIRRTGLFGRCRANVVKRKMIMPDQTSLNRLAESKLYLPDRFNEQRAKKRDTVIKHFCKGIRYLPFFHIYNVKQWQREKVRKVLKIDWLEEIWEEYDKLVAACDIEK